MNENWPKLDRPPVVLSMFQMKYEWNEENLDSFVSLDSEIRKKFPKMVKNIAAKINIPSDRIHVGRTTVTGSSDAKIDRYTYLSEDQKSKLVITEDAISYINESKYVGWNHFSSEVSDCLALLGLVLDSKIITRTSIRFVNNFEFETFENPEEYVKTMIVSSEDEVLPYPVLKYGFRMILDVNDNVYSIVNQNFDNPAGKPIYIFDIDVLDRRNIVFDPDIILSIVNDLRIVKNDIFFNNLTKKTLDLCK